MYCISRSLILCSVEAILQVGIQVGGKSEDYACGAIDGPKDQKLLDGGEDELIRGCCAVRFSFMDDYIIFKSLSNLALRAEMAVC